MNVHFIDTSVFTEILNVPNMNDHHAGVMKELKKMIVGKDTLILPFATIIETGNHIAQNGNGNQKRAAAERFTECILKTVNGQAPWSYYGEQMTKEELRVICRDFCDYAMCGEGFGDLSIIRAYERYKAETPAISRIRIWSQDTHLQSYDETLHMGSRRNR
ncbi:MAG: hypothetical protein ACLTKI_01475 [Lachnospiraceae bacterium]